MKLGQLFQRTFSIGIFVFLLFENAASEVELGGLSPENSMDDDNNFVKEKQEAGGGLEERFFPFPTPPWNPTPSPPSPWNPTPPAKPPSNCPVCACIQEYAPVCGTDGGTYSNSCMLTCASMCYHMGMLKEAHAGACGTVGGGTPPRPGGGGLPIFVDQPSGPGSGPGGSGPGTCEGCKPNPNRPRPQYRPPGHGGGGGSHGGGGGSHGGGGGSHGGNFVLPGNSIGHGHKDGFQFLCFECHVYFQSQSGSGVGIEQIVERPIRPPNNYYHG